MNRTFLALGATIATVAVAAAPAGATAPLAQEQGVTHVEQIPINGSVGANFKTYADGRTYMFVTGTAGSPKTDPGLLTQIDYGGLWVYDVDDAEHPKLVSHLPLPHYENEDVSLGGNRLLISGDGTLGASNLAVIDIADPAFPKIEKIVNNQIGGAGHTATCIQDCKYAWVAGAASIAVLRLDEAAQLPLDDHTGGVLPGVQVQASESKVEAGDLALVREFGWSTHDVQVDDAGYAWVVGGNGTVAFDTRPGHYGEDNLLTPAVVARTGPDALNSGGDSGLGPDGSTVNDFIHHNSWHPDANALVSRADDDLADDTVRPGEKLLVTEEDIWDRKTAATTRGGCETQGSFQTWQVKQLKTTDQDTATVKFLDDWTTEFNAGLAQDPTGLSKLVLNGGFCSSHYFDEQDGIVATAWYEQGTRILDTRDPRHIKQIGYFMAPDSVVWAAYWAPTGKDVIYVLDHQRGIDVLKVGAGGSVAKRKRVVAPLAKWWRKSKKALAAENASLKFGWACRLAL